jgi:methionine synthase I (cobalamin-dependent)
MATPSAVLTSITFDDSQQPSITKKKKESKEQQTPAMQHLAVQDTTVNRSGSNSNSNVNSAITLCAFRCPINPAHGVESVGHVRSVKLTSDKYNVSVDSVEIKNTCLITHYSRRSSNRTFLVRKTGSIGSSSA